MPVPTDQREEFFCAHLTALMKKYRMGLRQQASHRDCQRFAYLCANLICKMYESRLMSDAYCWFYNWAWSKKIKCSKLPEEQYDKDGQFVCGPWPSTFKRFYENLSFQKYLDLAEQVIIPERDPIRVREPVTWINYRKGRIIYVHGK